MLNTRVLSLSVLTNEDGVDIVVGWLETLNGNTRTHIGEELEGPTKSKVQRHVSLANCRVVKL